VTAAEVADDGNEFIRGSWSKIGQRITLSISDATVSDVYHLKNTVWLCRQLENEDGSGR
jgi:hypothetical protein